MCGARSPPTSPTRETGRCWCFPLERRARPRQETRMATTNSAVSIADTPPPPRRKRGWNPFRLNDKPFFEDKNRAFWILQSIGWAGYFFLRTISNIANEKIASFVIHYALLT